MHSMAEVLGMQIYSELHTNAMKMRKDVSGKQNESANAGEAAEVTARVALTAGPEVFDGSRPAYT